MSRYEARVDNKHGEVRDGLREAGYYVIDMSQTGHGVLDLEVVSKKEVRVLLEVKTPGEYPTKKQFFYLWRHQPASIVFGLEDALEVMERYD